MEQFNEIKLEPQVEIIEDFNCEIVDIKTETLDEPALNSEVNEESHNDPLKQEQMQDTETFQEYNMEFQECKMESNEEFHDVKPKAQKSRKQQLVEKRPISPYTFLMTPARKNPTKKKKQNHGKVKCKCGKQFVSMKTYKIHYSKKCKLAHKNMYRKCYVCDYKIKSEDSNAILKHVSSKHFKIARNSSVTNILECRMCDYRCKHTETICHIKKFHNYNDQVKNNIAPNKHVIEFTCTQCTVPPFELENQLVKHMKKFHQQTLYSCDQCNYHSKNKTLFDKHTEVHFDRQYSCEHCCYQVKSKTSYNKHLLKHPLCTQCNVTFENYIKLKIHETNDHFTMLCSYCKEKVTFSENFVSFIQSSSFRCRTCNEFFLTSNCLNIHKENNLGYACNNCEGYSFSNGFAYTKDQLIE